MRWHDPPFSAPLVLRTQWGAHRCGLEISDSAVQAKTTKLPPVTITFPQPPGPFSHQPTTGPSVGSAGVMSRGSTPSPQTSPHSSGVLAQLTPAVAAPPGQWPPQGCLATAPACRPGSLGAVCPITAPAPRAPASAPWSRPQASATGNTAHAAEPGPLGALLPSSSRTPRSTGQGSWSWAHPPSVPVDCGRPGGPGLMPHSSGQPSCPFPGRGGQLHGPGYFLCSWKHKGEPVSTARPRRSPPWDHLRLSKNGRMGVSAFLAPSVSIFAHLCVQVPEGHTEVPWLLVPSLPPASPLFLRVPALPCLLGTLHPTHRTTKTETVNRTPRVRPANGSCLSPPGSVLKI